MNNSGNDHEAQREAVISSSSENTTNSSNSSFLRSISNNSQNSQGSSLNRLRPRSIYIKQESSGSERDSTVTSSTATGSAGFQRPTPTSALFSPFEPGQSNEVSSSYPPTPIQIIPSPLLQQENIVSSSSHANLSPTLQYQLDSNFSSSLLPSSQHSNLSQDQYYDNQSSNHLSNSTPEEWCCTTLNVTKFSYIWAISNFSYCREEMGEVLKSTNFSGSKNNDLKWCLKVNPRGLDDESKDYLSVFLTLETEQPTENTDNSDNATETPEVRAKFKFSILNSEREETKAMESQKAYKFVEGKDWGFKKFIRRDFLMAEDNGLLPGDVLTLLCEVSVVGQETTTNIRSQISDSSVIPAVPSPRLAYDLSTLLNANSEFADVKFEVTDVNGKHEISANKSILACRSPVFMAMFKKSKKSFQEALASTPTVKITDMSPTIFRKMMNFIYTDNLTETGYNEIAFNETQELLAAADKYQLERLKIICERKLCNFITVSNVCSVLVRADMHGSRYLKDKCLEFINLNCMQVTETQAWTMMAEQHPRLLMIAFKSLANSKIQSGPGAPVRKKARIDDKINKTVIDRGDN